MAPLITDFLLPPPPRFHLMQDMRVKIALSMKLILTHQVGFNLLSQLFASYESYGSFCLKIILVYTISIYVGAKPHMREGTVGIKMEAAIFLIPYCRINIVYTVSNAYSLLLG